MENYGRNCLLEKSSRSFKNLITFMMSMLLPLPQTYRRNLYPTPETVGHVPSSVGMCFFAMQCGCVFKAKVINNHPVKSLLTKGGLEVEITVLVTVIWSDKFGRKIDYRYCQQLQFVNKR